MLHFQIDKTELHRKIAATKAALERDIVRSVARATTEGRNEAKSGAWKDQTGRLRASITVSQLGWSGNTYWESFKTGVDYARFVNYDTAPHWIFPKAGYNTPVRDLMPGQSRRARGKGPHEHIVGRGQALRWTNGSGESVFARNVYHPGTAGFHFMERGADWARINLINELRNGFENIRSVWVN